MKNKHINNIIITGGGTGGHLIPSFAIADALKKQKPNVDIRFIGSNTGIESKLYKKRSEKYYLISIKGIRRSFSFKAFIENIIIFPFNVLKSSLKVFRIFKDFKPDIVIGTGGYSSAIPLFVARLKKIKIVLQEQNAIPGLVNKIFIKKSKLIFFGFKPFNKRKNFIHSGNPTLLLKNNINKDKVRTLNVKSNKLTILILGGSQGSVPINNHFIKVYKKYIDMGIHLIWQCGENNVNDLKKIIKSKQVDLCGFINPPDMPNYYNKADLVISRAGALTLSELANYNLPSILIPFPYAANNHQLYNARYFHSNHSAMIVEQKDLKIGKLESEVEGILDDMKVLENMKKQVKKIAKPDAADYIAKKVLKV